MPRNYSFEEPIRRVGDIDFDTIDQRTGLHPSSSNVLGGLSVNELARSSIHQDFEKIHSHRTRTRDAQSH